MLVKQLMTSICCWRRSPRQSPRRPDGEGRKEEKEEEEEKSKLKDNKDSPSVAATATAAAADRDEDSPSPLPSSSSDNTNGTGNTLRLSLTNSNAVGFHRTQSEKQHAEYLEKLEVPTLEQISSIAQVQEAKEKEIAEKYDGGDEQGVLLAEETEVATVAALNKDSSNGKEQEHDEEANAAAREQAAAGKIQKTYRGHRARRELNGLTLDPTTRWVEALKAARFQNITDPKRQRGSGAGFTATNASSPERRQDDADGVDAGITRRSLEARSHWHHVSNIASHAMGEIPQEEDRPRGSMSSVSSQRPRISASLNRDEAASPDRISTDAIEEEEESRGSIFSKVGPMKRKKKNRKPWTGKMMDLPYFLEMVDAKHRYGSNLRAYHGEWKKSNTHQNFFYWLDYGEGKDVEIDAVSRERLEKEHVRYLSREERLDYLVNVDPQGRLVWAKNGERITTSTEYRDSVGGIVPTTSSAKMFREDEIKAIEESHASSSRQSSDGSNADGQYDDDDDDNDDDGTSTLSSPFGSATASPMSTSDVSDAERRYPDPPGLKNSKGPAKVKHVSAHAILNRLLRKTLSKNTWIFVADTSMNLYVGIKQSGSFQHSSFMHGSRISAAGTIKVKDGQLRALNPLSGHYRPPARAFRHFVRHLRASRVDTSRVSISKSYAVLVGLEAYMSGRRKAKDAERKVGRAASLVVHPSKAREQREREKDHSQSAELERARLREEKGTLGRVLEDARERVEERWTAIREPDAAPQSAALAADTDPGSRERGGGEGGEQTADPIAGCGGDDDQQQKLGDIVLAAGKQTDSKIPSPNVPHQTGLDKKYKEPGQPAAE